jgi:hypothetical protein
MDSPIYGPKLRKHLLQTGTILETMEALKFERTWRRNKIIDPRNIFSILNFDAGIQDGGKIPNDAEKMYFC